MSLRYRKSLKLLPGVRVNLSKSGISTTIGPKGASVNIGKKGTYLNTGVPGTGLYDRTKISAPQPRPARSSNAGPALYVVLIMVVVIGLVLMLH